VNVVFRYALVVLLIAATILPAWAKKKTSHARASNKTDVNAAARLQVFLDRANFSPGKIDGRFNEFTRKALALYSESLGGPPQSPTSQIDPKSNIMPDVTGLDLASVQPVFVPYTVTEADLQSVGPLPKEVSAEAKLTFLPYRDGADALAEKFHSDVHFLNDLNPGKMKTIKPGDQLMVPNVEPFELASVKAIKPGGEVASQAANDIEESGATPSENPEQNKGAAMGAVVKIDTKTNMLTVYQGDKLTAAYPVTVGSVHTASPIGEWKVRGIAKLPTFRYDKEMLQHGKRSGNFYVLRPGPRNPVGVMWIALNKKGIGIHGTSEPDSIGRAASHGCIRLANWDVVRLATKIKSGDVVSIH
jgi:lipoprotein-anchoring transpeptidase ErfK/SrfK